MGLFGFNSKKELEKVISTSGKNTHSLNNELVSKLISTIKDLHEQIVALTQLINVNDQRAINKDSLLIRQEYYLARRYWEIVSKKYEKEINDLDKLNKNGNSKLGTQLKNRMSNFFPDDDKDKQLLVSIAYIKKNYLEMGGEARGIYNLLVHLKK